MIYLICLSIYLVPFFICLGYAKYLHERDFVTMGIIPVINIGLAFGLPVSFLIFFIGDLLRDTILARLYAWVEGE